MADKLDSNEELKKNARPDHKFRDIDLTYPIQDQIQRMVQRDMKPNKRAFRRPVVASITVLSIAFMSFTAYAASEHLQIFNQQGKVIVKTTDPSPGLPEKLSRQLEDYRIQVQSELKPGELAAYYIHDEYINTTNGYDTVNPIKYEYRPLDYTTYESFEAELKRTHAPQLALPERLPDGWSFSYGQLSPRGLFRVGDEKIQYDSLKQRLTDLAIQEQDGETLFIEKLKWTHATSATLYLTDGTNKHALSLQATYGSNISLPHQANGTSEKIMLNHLEAIYQRSESGEMRIAWYDSKQGIAYNLSLNEHGALSKKQLQQMAASMVED